MHVTRFTEARRYEAKKHFDMAGLQLQGGEASRTDGVSVSLSYFLPGGGAERSASATDKYYVVIEGELTIESDDGEHVLGAFDSCHIGRDEPRAIINRSTRVTTMLVVVIA